MRKDCGESAREWLSAWALLVALWTPHRTREMNVRWEAVAFLPLGFVLTRVWSRQVHHTFSFDFLILDA